MKLSVEKRRSLVGLLFLIPWFSGFLLFFAFPLYQSVVFSLNKVKITAKGRSMKFVGWQNYTDTFLKDEYFVSRLVNFFKEAALELPLIIVFALLIALLLNQKIKAKGMFRTLFFLPIIVVSGPVLNMLISDGVTTIPLIEQYDLYGIVWSVFPRMLAEPISSLFSRLLLILWYSGVPILIFFAGLQKIDIALYEASFIDGASSWVAFFKIVLPSLKGLVFINAIYILVFLATSEINDVIILIRDNMLNPSKGFGISSAMAWIYSIGIILVIGIIFALLGRENARSKRPEAVYKQATHTWKQPKRNAD